MARLFKERSLQARRRQARALAWSGFLAMISSRLQPAKPTSQDSDSGATQALAEHWPQDHQHSPLEVARGAFDLRIQTPTLIRLFAEVANDLRKLEGCLQHRTRVEAISFLEATGLTFERGAIPCSEAGEPPPSKALLSCEDSPSLPSWERCGIERLQGESLIRLP